MTYPGEQPPYGQSPYGQAPYGQSPYGSFQHCQGSPAARALRPAAAVPADARLPSAQYQYAQPQVPLYPPVYRPKTNGLAITSMVLALAGILITCVPFFNYLNFAVQVVALILGIVARAKIKETGEAGGGMALAGIIISSVVLGLTVLAVIFLGGLLASMGAFGA